MSIRNHTLIVFLFTILNILPAFSQNEIWPVQVSGTMLPPHSLNLKVYGVDRTSDLVFNAQLRDPAQGAIYVKPRVTIEQNGTILNQTDPNFIDEPVLLSQFENKVLDGGFLSKYLSNFAMAGYGGQGQGSIDVPEGFNQICIQMYGIDRDVPVSNKFCVSGNFRLNQPPQITKPYFNEKIAFKENQNLLFSWTPMHIGSGNNPGPVEYDFELVELPLGVMNANDVFESALKIYRTTALTNSLIYTPGEPNLEPNKFYAWRVTARSIMFGSSKLFQNDGKSEVSMFVLYEGEEPDLTFNPAGVDIPRGCSVFETSFRAVIKSENQSNVLVQNQKVQVGYFDMVIGDVYGGIQGYSGKGWIDYPMLRSKIEVEFENIKVNKDGRVYEAESIEANIKDGLFLSKDNLTSEVIQQNVTDAYALKLYNSISTSNNVSKGTLKKNILPIAIQNDQFADAMVCVTGIKFTPRNAYLTLVGLEHSGNTKKPKVGDLSISAATAIAATPYGVKNGAYLVPVSTSASGSNVYLTSTILKSVSMEKASRFYCDCNGFKKSEVKEDLFISDDILVDKNGKSLKLPLKDTKQPSDMYNGEVSNLNDFKIKGFDDYLFTSGSGILNLNESKTVTGLPVESASGKVLWLKNNKLQLPSKYAIGSEKNIELSGDLVIGEEAIEYGVFKKSDIVPLSKGVIEKWRYSVDEISVAYEDETFSAPKFAGKVKLPVSSHQTNYTGTIVNASQGNPILSVDKFPEKLPIEMWKGEMALEANSYISMEIKNINEKQELYPTASLTGDFGMQIKQDELNKVLIGNIAQSIENIKNVFKLNTNDISFGISGLKIENWNFEPYSSTVNKYTPGNINTSDAKFTINGHDYPITSSTIIYKTDQGEKLGLSFTTVSGNSKISFTIWGVEKSGSFTFDGIELNSYELKCDCETGKLIGMIDYDHLYDNIIRKQFMPYLSEPKHNGGTSSIIDGLNLSEAIVYASWKEELQENTFDGFILKDNKTLYWPLLERDIKVESDDSSIKAATIFLSNDDLKRMGFKTDVWIPERYVLAIKELLINKNKQEGKKASISFSISPIQTAYGNVINMDFTSISIPVTGTTIEINNLRFSSNLMRIDNKDGVTWTFGEGENACHATLDCTNGLYIELNGILNLNEIQYDNPSKVTSIDGSDVQIPIRAIIENTKGRSLENYIGVCENFNPLKRSIDWNFIVQSNPNIIFRPGKSFEIYYDYHSKMDPDSLDAISLGFGTDNKSFKGLFFKKMSAEINGLYEGDGRPLELSIQNALFVNNLANKNGFYCSKSDTDVLDETSGAHFSGWKYRIDSLSFKIEESAMDKNLTLVGAMAIPIFKENPTKILKSPFDRSWVEFKGEILSFKGEMKSTLGFQSLKGKLYQSILLPGMVTNLNESSVLNLNYNAENGSWNPLGAFSGSSRFYMSDHIAGLMEIINYVPGLDMFTKSIQFENIIVDSSPFEDSYEIKLEEENIAHVYFGNWGDDTDEEEDDDEDEEDDEDNDDKKDNKKEDDDIEVNTMLGFDIVTKCLGLQAIDGQLKFGLEVEASLMGSSAKTNNSTGETQSSTFQIKGNGVVTLDFSPESGKGSQETFKFSGIGFECLTVDAEVGPVTFEGGLKIFSKDETYGTGVKGYVSGGIDKLGGLNGVAQFGSIDKDKGDYYYGFVDLELFSETGFPQLWDPITNLPKIDIYGGGAGLSFNMNTERTYDDNTSFNFPDKEKVAESERKWKLINDKKTISIGKSKPKDFCDHLGDGRFENGRGLNQVFVPKRGYFGGHGFVIVGPYSPDPGPINLVGDIGLQMDVQVDLRELEFSFGAFSLFGRGYLLPESIRERRTKNKGDLYVEGTFDWTNKKLDAELAFRTQFKLSDAIDIIAEQAKVAGDNTADKTTTASSNNNSSTTTSNSEDKSTTQKKDDDDDDAGILKSLDILLYSMPKESEYKKTDPVTRANYNKGRITLSFDPDDPYFSVKLGGPGTNNLTPLSGTYLTRYFPLSHSTVEAYAQIGANVDPVPSIKKMLPELEYFTDTQDETMRQLELEEAGRSVASDSKGSTADSTKTEAKKRIEKLQQAIKGLQDELKTANKQDSVFILEMIDEKLDKIQEERDNAIENLNILAPGIAFGLTLEKNVVTPFYFINANLQVKAGVDLNLRHYDDTVRCANIENKGQIGFSGWYAQGKAFAYARGNIDLKFDLFGADFKYSVVDLRAFLTMEMQGPNPTYFIGWVGGSYSVLDGMFEGKFTYPVEIGEQCEALEAPDPLAKITIFNKASISKNATNVNRYSDISLFTNVPLRNDYSLTQLDRFNNASHTVAFRADVINIKVKKMPIIVNKPRGEALKMAYINKAQPKMDTVYLPEEEVKMTWSLKPNNKEVVIVFDDVLDPYTTYKLEYEFGWKEKQGTELNTKYTDRDMPEQGTIQFVTGGRPTTIFDGMIEYAAPGVKQRYWHKGYADTEIKFKLKALNDAVNLFPEICKECPQALSISDTVKYVYIAKLQEFDENGEPGQSYNFPVTNFPGKGENVTILEEIRESVDNGKYYLNYLKEKLVAVSVVSFPGLKNFEVQKGKIYELSIIREIDQNDLSIARQNIEGEKLDKLIAEYRFILKKYYFGTSLYVNLEEKLSNLEVTHEKSLIKLRDFSHPSDIADSERAGLISRLGESEFHSVKDDYYAFRIKNRKGNESFDAYDIMRMKRNIQLKYNNPYYPEDWIGFIHNGHGLLPDFDKFLSSAYSTQGGTYLRKVVQDYRKHSMEGAFGEFGVGDGSKWHYALSGSPEDKSLKLTDEEINSKLFHKPVENKVTSVMGMQITSNSSNNQFTTNKDPNSDLPVFTRPISYDFLIQDLRSRIVINQMFWLSRISKVIIDSYSNNNLKNWANNNYPLGEFKGTKGGSDFKWIVTPTSYTSYKKDPFTYIASEPGYRLSYHGKSEILFPKTGAWGELLSSKRDEGVTMNTLKGFSPIRDAALTSTYEVKDVNELSTDEWYEINYHGNIIKAEHNDRSVVFDKWGLEPPLGNSSHVAQYYLYNPAQGLLGDRDFEPVEDPKGNNNWNFISEGGGFNIINNQNQRQDNLSKCFPYMMDRYRGSAGLLPKKDFSKNSTNTISVLSEVSYNMFSPNSMYYISHNNTPLKDYKDNTLWRIIKDGKFYRIISVSGELLYGHYEHNTLSSDKWYVNTEKFSGLPPKFGNRNERDTYYRRVWCITPVPNSSDEYYIQNVNYVRHFLKPAKIDGQNKVQMSEEKAIKIKIIELK